jgi:hypothetical protein
MKRKTNLFYNTGQDSKFLTFSNYTEALTGNFLSTNTKLFPSTFLCLNIPSLTSENKSDFIKDVLIAKYENKLASLRDIVGEGVLPLQYLLEYLLEFDANTTISYIGNITEQDYMGAFTDTICIIDCSVFQSAIIENPEYIHLDVKEVESTLYGWYDNGQYMGPSTYADLVPVFDSANNEYYADSGISVTYNSGHKPNNIDFNVVLPLFTFVNINSGLESDDNMEITLEGTFNKNVPLGIWFADKMISLDTNTLYGQSWSLAIGSQFKPLPTSNKVVSDITKQSNTEAFNTFAQILSRQNELLTTLENINKRIDDLTRQVNSIKNNPLDLSIRQQIEVLSSKINQIESNIQ